MSLLMCPARVELKSNKDSQARWWQKVDADTPSTASLIIWGKDV